MIVPIMGPKAKRAGEELSLFGATRQAVLGLFFTHPDERFYQRQVIRLVGLGSGAVQRDLEHLTSMGILTREVEGRQTYFRANQNSPIYSELHSLVRKTFGVADVLRTALSPLAPQIRVAFVYGSIARGGERVGSDIDLMVVGDQPSLDPVVSALMDTQKELGREVNPSVYSTDEFCRKLSEKNHFLTSVLKGQKLFIIGNDRELERLEKERLAKRPSDKPARNRKSVRGRR